VDRKHDAHKSSTSENDQETTQSKSRVKKESANDSVNYLSLFQLNPLLMHAGVAQSQTYQQSLATSQSPTKTAESIKSEVTDEFVDKSNNNNESELIEIVLEQKILHDTFDMINMIESQLQGQDIYSNGSYDYELSESFLSSLTDESMADFKIQLPNLLPKMHFVCEIGSRILFKVSAVIEMIIFFIFSSYFSR
jgi:hypothetical protein